MTTYPNVCAVCGSTEPHIHGNGVGEIPFPQKPKPVAFTVKDGGDWYDWGGWPQDRRERGIHAIKFDDGSIFDAVNGWRKTPPKPIWPRCGNCRFWQTKVEGTNGVCRRYPPPAGNCLIITTEAYWCGEYKRDESRG